jgi:hypothetical protein
MLLSLLHHSNYPCTTFVAADSTAFAVIIVKLICAVFLGDTNVGAEIQAIVTLSANATGEASPGFLHTFFLRDASIDFGEVSNPLGNR